MEVGESSGIVLGLLEDAGVEEGLTSGVEVAVESGEEGEGFGSDDRLVGAWRRGTRLVI